MKYDKKTYNDFRVTDINTLQNNFFKSILYLKIKIIKIYIQHFFLVLKTIAVLINRINREKLRSYLIPKNVW